MILTCAEAYEIKFNVALHARMSGVDPMPAVRWARERLLLLIVQAATITSAGVLKAVRLEEQCVTRTHERHATI